MHRRILVVDDEPDLELLITQKYRRQIRNQEIAFIFASDGVDALEKLEHEHEVDMILTDINMPRMDGLTLLANVSEKYPRLKSVIVSAYGDMTNIRTALNRGAFDFLTKPIDFQDLEITIRKTLEQVHLLKRAISDRDHLVAIRNELEVARRIQEAILPQNFPPFPEHTEFELHASMNAAQKVGGDFYDFFMIDENHLGFAIGDVSGKGVPAAIFMAVSRALLKATALRGVSPHECLLQVNRLLQSENSTSMFVTVFYAILELSSGMVEFSNGGHNPPYLLKSKGEIAQLELTHNFVLGAFAMSSYQSKKVQLDKGDSLILYTDGVTEANNQQGNQFSESGLQECLVSMNGQSAREIVDIVFNKVQEYSGTTPQSDDITVLALKYLGS
jgi:sigma-B regulation protein RsbU (phosphoserine phosphatase)